MNKKSFMLYVLVGSTLTSCANNSPSPQNTKILSIKTVTTVAKNDKKTCKLLAPLLLELDAETFKNMEKFYTFESNYPNWNFELSVENSKLSVSPEKYTEVEVLLSLSSEKFKYFTCAFPQSFITKYEKLVTIKHRLFYPNYMKNTTWSTEYYSRSFFGNAQNMSFGGMFIQKVPEKQTNRYHRRHEIIPLWSYKEEKESNWVKVEDIRQAYSNFDPLLKNQNIEFKIITNEQENIIKWSKQPKAFAFALSPNKTDFMYYNTLNLKSDSTASGFGESFDYTKEAYLYSDNSNDFINFKKAEDYKKSLPNVSFNDFNIWDIKKQRYINTVSIEEREKWADFNDKRFIDMIEIFLTSSQAELWLNVVVEAENSTGYESILGYYDKNGELHQENSQIIKNLTTIKLPAGLIYSHSSGN